MQRKMNCIQRVLFGISVLAWLLFLGRSLQASRALGGLNLVVVEPRIVTPNGDGKDDVAFFKFDSDLTGIPVTGDVFDITGAKVGSLGVSTVNNHWLSWDGKDSDGKVVPSGIYIYLITLGNSRLTGAVVVAR